MLLTECLYLFMTPHNWMPVPIYDSTQLNACTYIWLHTTECLYLYMTTHNWMSVPIYDYTQAVLFNSWFLDTLITWPMSNILSHQTQATCSCPESCPNQSITSPKSFLSAILFHSFHVLYNHRCNSVQPTCVPFRNDVTRKWPDVFCADK